MAELVSANEYARRRGVSHTAVNKAIAGGRLKTSVVKKARGRGVLIDPEAADREWKHNTNPAQSRSPQARAGGPSKPGRTPDLRLKQTAFVENGPAAGESAAEKLSAPDRDKWLSAQASRTDYQARLARLKFEERTRQLVPVEEVRSRAFAAGRKMRDVLTSIPDRVSALAAAEQDEARVRALLVAEIQVALDELTALETQPLKPDD